MRARSAELLSDAAEDFVRESRILHGASQYYATDHRCCLKDGFLPVSTLGRENFLKSLPKPKPTGPAHPFAEEEMWGGKGLK